MFIKIILIHQRYSIGETDEKARQQLNQLVPNMRQWYKKFLNVQPKSEVRR